MITNHLTRLDNSFTWKKKCLTSQLMTTNITFRGCSDMREGGVCHEITFDDSRSDGDGLPSMMDDDVGIA